MALRGALTHRKTRRLAKLLGVPVPCALGVMEALWQVTGARCPLGDIGQLTNQDIAEEMFWDGDPDALIALLLQCALLDPSDTHRLIVHGWSERADDSLHAAIARRREWFADGTEPKTTKLNSAEKATAEQFYSSAGRREHSRSTPEELPISAPNHAMPCPTKPCPSPPCPPPGVGREKRNNGRDWPPPPDDEPDGVDWQPYHAGVEAFLQRTANPDEWEGLKAELQRYAVEGLLPPAGGFVSFCEQQRHSTKEATGKWPFGVKPLTAALCQAVGDRREQRARRMERAA